MSDEHKESAAPGPDAGASNERVGEEARVGVVPEPSPSVPRTGSPAHSLRPVGIDLLAPPVPAGVDPILAGELALAARRRPRRLIVVCSLAICGVILVAAGVHRARSRALARATASMPVPAVSTSAPPAAASPPADTPAANGEGPATWSDSYPGTQSAKPPPPPAPTTGTLRLRRPAQPGWVWLDGTKLKVASTVVSCGAHKVRVGARGRPHDIDVPCGGELAISQ
jgi:hypothetical protein